MINEVLHYTVQRETFEGENFSQFRGFVAIRESFLCEIWGRGIFLVAPVSTPRKFSLRKSYLPPIRESFLPPKFPAIR